MNTDSAGGAAIASRTSGILNDSLNLDTRGTEVDYQAKIPSGRPQVIDALRSMRAIKCPHGFQFDKHNVFNQQIDKVFADHGALIGDRNPPPLLNG